jgi:hypothetical protein
MPCMYSDKELERSESVASLCHMRRRIHACHKELERSESVASLIKQQLYLEQQKRQKVEDRRAHAVRKSEMLQREKVRVLK